MAHCVKCYLPDRVKNADFDGGGVCRFCRDDRSTVGEDLTIRSRQREDLEKALQDCRGQGEYDCLLALSGGKDSCYLAYKLKVEYKLKVLAFTYRNHNAPACALDSVNRTVAKLGLDHIAYTESREFYRKLYRFLLQNQEARGAEPSVCHLCGGVRESYVMRLAVEKRIPLILVGFSPGQPDPSIMQYEAPRKRISETDWTPPILRESGQFSEEELAKYWNPARYPAGTRFPRYLAPFHVWDYNQKEVIRQCVRLGLIKDRQSADPVNSNCRLIWLLMYSDLKNLGYNTYSPEFSKLIRQGKDSLWYWKTVMPILNRMVKHQVFYGRHVRDYLRWLDLKPEDLRITRPALEGDGLAGPREVAPAPAVMGGDPGVAPVPVEV